MRASVALGALLTLVGCGYQGPQDIPLPGAIGGKDTYPVTIVLTDATKLVPRLTCRANDAIVGSIESVELDDQLHARVVCRIKRSVRLPSNAEASIRETSLLGERFVSLALPEGSSPIGTLSAGATIDETRTRVDPNVEMLLGALSQVLNGGSLQRLDTITRELNLALSGSYLKGTINQVDHAVATLDANRTTITTALESVANLSRQIADERSSIAAALTEIPEGVEVLNDESDALVDTFEALARLSTTAVPLIKASREDFLADLDHLRPILTELSKSGHDLALALERAASWPFPNNVTSIIRGDYGGMYVNGLVDLDLLNELLTENALINSTPAPGSPEKPTTKAGPDPGLDSPNITDQPVDELLRSLDGLLGGLGGLLGGVRP